MNPLFDQWQKRRVAGSSLSYPVAQNIAQQDLFGEHYDEEYFTEPRSRIPLERLHKITITKTEMNQDSKKKKKRKKRRLFNCSSTFDSETYSRVFPNIIGNSIL